MHVIALQKVKATCNAFLFMYYLSLGCFEEHFSHLCLSNFTLSCGTTLLICFDCHFTKMFVYFITSLLCFKLFSFTITV